MILYFKCGLAIFICAYQIDPTNCSTNRTKIQLLPKSLPGDLKTPKSTGPSCQIKIHFST